LSCLFVQVVELLHHYPCLRLLEVIPVLVRTIDML
jgi:hypothetical protein